MRPLQHPPAVPATVVPGQRLGPLDQVLALFAAAILVGIESVAQSLEQARFDDARDDQPALNVKKIGLALA
ncbi:MAG TPA: hypothetical protein VNW50_02405 [Streptosporangiaceae bacterium]|nr:hypothetical protein [Streptosporangiaceae bacterium]